MPGRGSLEGGGGSGGTPPGACRGWRARPTKFSASSISDAASSRSASASQRSPGLVTPHGSGGQPPAPPSDAFTPIVPRRNAPRRLSRSSGTAGPPRGARRAFPTHVALSVDWWRSVVRGAARPSGLTHSGDIARLRMGERRGEAMTPEGPTRVGWVGPRLVERSSVRVRSRPYGTSARFASSMSASPSARVTKRSTINWPTLRTTLPT